MRSHAPFAAHRPPCSPETDAAVCGDAADDVHHPAPPNSLRAVHPPVEPAAAVLPAGTVRVLLLSL
jgi:hypothetical protein